MIIQKNKLDVVIATFNREDCILDAVMSLLEYDYLINNIIIVNSGSTDNTKNILENLVNNKIIIVQIDENKGASFAKNRGLERVVSDYVVVIDDDAELISGCSLEDIFEIFEKNPKTGIIQMRIINYWTLKTLKNEFPAPLKFVNIDRLLKVSTFVGAGHVISKKVIDKIGFYDEKFFYGHEELDYSFRAISQGFEILYHKKIGVYHKKNPKGRLSTEEYIYSIFYNRLLISYKYLSNIYFIVNCILWFLKSIQMSRSLNIPFSVLYDFYKKKGEIIRKPLTNSAIAYLKKNYGRCWY